MQTTTPDAATARSSSRTCISGHAAAGRISCSTSSPRRMRRALSGRRHHRRLAAAQILVLDRRIDDVLRQILRMARRGVAVTYIPGNHDEMFRDWLGLRLRDRRRGLAREAVHEAADGRRYLVIHGDEFDGVIRYAKLPRPSRRLGLRLGADPQPRLQPGAAPARLSLLVAVAVAEAPGQGRGQGDRPLRGRAGRRGAAARLGRRGLRPYPPCRDAHRAGRDLHERRRLGGELHRARRASRMAGSSWSTGRRRTGSPSGQARAAAVAAA